MIRRTARSGWRMSLLAVAVLAAGACSSDPKINVMGPSGSLRILHVTHDLERQVESGELFIVGAPAADAMSLTRFDGQAALQFDAGARPYALARSVDALMTATPYLEWSWAAGRLDAGDLPLAVAVGLIDRASDASPDNLGARVLGQDIAPAHFLIVGLWRASPLQRGHLEIAPESARVALYGVRGGAGTPAWHRDGMDIETLFRRSWPGRNTRSVHVAWVAVAAMPGEARGYVADLVLHR